MDEDEDGFEDNEQWEEDEEDEEEDEEADEMEDEEAMEDAEEFVADLTADQEFDMYIPNVMGQGAFGGIGGQPGLGGLQPPNQVTFPTAWILLSETIALHVFRGSCGEIRLLSYILCGPRGLAVGQRTGEIEKFDICAVIPWQWLQVNMLSKFCHTLLYNQEPLWTNGTGQDPSYQSCRLTSN